MGGYLNSRQPLYCLSCISETYLNFKEFNSITQVKITFSFILCLEKKKKKKPEKLTSSMSKSKKQKLQLHPMLEPLHFVFVFKYF